MKSIQSIFTSSKAGWLILALLVLPFVMQAQAVQATLDSVQTWVVDIVQIFFVIGIVVGIIRVVISFLSGSPNAPRQLIYVIVAALVYFGFAAVIGDFQLFGPGIDTITP